MTEYNQIPKFTPLFPVICNLLISLDAMTTGAEAVTWEVTVSASK